MILTIRQKEDIIKIIDVRLRFFFRVLAMILMAGLCDLSVQGAKGVSRELAAMRKSDYAHPSYSLHFDIPSEKSQKIKGRVGIGIELGKRQDIVIDFRGDAAQIEGISVNGKAVEGIIGDEHIVIPQSEVAVGANEVKIDFEASDVPLNRRGDLLYTLLVPDRARTLFPCFDQPDMKSVYTLSLSVPDGWEAVSNSPVVSEDLVSEEGRKVIRFAPTEPLSTYLFSFVAGKMSRAAFTRDGRTISIFHRETDPAKIAQTGDIANEVFDALEWQEAYTGIPYPFAKYDVIILPGFQFGGMEHTGATLSNDNRMFLNANPTLNERLSRSSLIAHETSHMWFGDLVTMAWFDDVWTKEVFANYYAARMMEPMYKGVDHELNFMLDYAPAAYAEDRTAGSNPVKQQLGNLSDAGLMYGNIIYNKSPLVMRMMVDMMGEEPFREGVAEYLRTYSFGNADWDGLIDILDKHTDVDLREFSKMWISEKGMPHIESRIEGDSLVVTQSDSWGRGLVWPQDITYVLDNGIMMSKVKVSLRGKEIKVPVPQKMRGLETAVFPNADGHSYGHFILSSNDIDGAIRALVNDKCSDVLRGSLLLTLYENLVERRMDAVVFAAAIMGALPLEKNQLLYSQELAMLSDCARLFNVDGSAVEDAMWQLVISAPTAPQRRQALNTYKAVAHSAESLNRLYEIWEKNQSPTGVKLTENEQTDLAMVLARRIPEKSATIISIQTERITNPDRKARFAYLAPSLSSSKEVRDSVFKALLEPRNRRIEPWAQVAMANLNCAEREAESVEYIRPALEELVRVQHTGDIFFPRGWVGALLRNHNSIAAFNEVEKFLNDNPDYSPLLKSKILQQADHLYRLKAYLNK